MQKHMDWNALISPSNYTSLFLTDRGFTTDFIDTQSPNLNSREGLAFRFHQSRGPCIVYLFIYLFILFIYML